MPGDYQARLEKHLALALLGLEQVRSCPHVEVILRGDVNGLACALRELDLFGYAQVRFDQAWAQAKSIEHENVELNWNPYA